MRSGICTPTCSRFGTLSRRYLAAFCLRHGCLRSCECLRKRGLCLRALRWCLDDGCYHFRYLDGGPAAVFHLLLPLIDCRVLETSSLTRSEGCYRHPKVRFRRRFQPSNAASAAVPGTAGRPQQRPGHRRLFQDLEFPSLDSRSDCSFHASLDGIGTRTLRVFCRSRLGAPHLVQPGYARPANGRLKICFLPFTPSHCFFFANLPPIFSD